MMVGEKGVEFGNQCAVYYEYGEAGEGCESNRMHVERDDVCDIEDEDFWARFDGTQWTVEYLWKEELLVLQGRVCCYEHTLKRGASNSMCLRNWLLVKYKGTTYSLGFGLNYTPKVMAKVLKTVLEKVTEVEQATSSCIGNIFIK